MHLQIKNLYGRFNYSISFIPSGITILTGPNGFGKSTILRCIEALNKSDRDFFANLPMDEFRFTPDSGAAIAIRKNGNCLLINGNTYSYKPVPVRKIPFQSRRYIELRLSNTDMPPTMSQDLQAMAQAAGTIKMIQEQRLVKERQETPISGSTRRVESNFVKAVDEIPQKIAYRIAQTASRYSETATKLDSSFPYRLLESRDEEDVLDEKTFSKRYKEMNEKLRVLASNGISETNDYQNLNFKESDAKVLKIFFDDFDEKYKVYEPLMKKLSLFQDIINRRFKFKSVTLSESHGLMVIDRETKEEIPLGNLSSGEQETLIMFYDLIFDTEKGTLILIDEPEISLHIEWQMMFIDDLKKIVEMNHLNAIVSTHSADIIGGNRDIQIDLGELYQNGLYSTDSNGFAQ